MARETSNRNTDAAWRYHDGTKHSYHSIRSIPHFLDWDNQPLPFKLYRDLEPIALPKEFPATKKSALETVETDVEATSGEKEPDLRSLAYLLFHSAGVTRVKQYPGGHILFRAAACTGALYHVEVYLACKDLPGLPAGLYHFGPSDFGLRALRAGDWRSIVVRAAGNPSRLASAPVIVFLTSTFWRNAWKYRERTYRHCYWDSGTLLANLLAVASALDLPAHVSLGFEDATVNRLLDLDTDREVTLALIALGRTSATAPPVPGPVERLGYETVPLSRSQVDYPAIRDIHEASSLDASEVGDWRGRELSAPASPVADDARLVPLEPLGPSDRPTEPLDTVILRRGSSRQFARKPISLAQLATILDAASRVLSADYREPGGASLVDLYVIAHAVDGLSSGAYFFHRKGKALEQLKAGDFRSDAAYLDLEQPLAGDAAANIYMMTDLEAVLDALGNRGYRAAQLEGGVHGGRIYLASYALGLGATGLTFYDDEVTRFFAPHAGSKSVMFLAAVGQSARRRVLFEK